MSLIRWYIVITIFALVLSPLLVTNIYAGDIRIAILDFDDSAVI